LKQYVWYNAQDSYFYENDFAYFDGLAVNAHLLAHNAKAFLALALETAKPFFILPDIHFFQFYSVEQFDNQKGGIRISWEKLRANYPEIVTNILDARRSLVVADFASQVSIGEFARKILDYQRSALAAPYQSLRRLLPIDSSVPRASFLVAPYFHFGSTNDPWYRLAIEMCSAAVAAKGTDGVYGVILCSSGCLNLQDVATISRDFSGINLDGFLIWVDDFDEHIEQEDHLTAFVELVRRLSLTGRPVMNLYGTHFSVLLKHFGLDGLGSGICVRDSMPAQPPPPMGGPAGGPFPRYYVPKVYRKFAQEEARRLTQLVPSLACDCEICSTTQILNLPSQSFTDRASVRRLMRRHFLRIRSREVNSVNSGTVTQSLSELSNDAQLVAGTPTTVYDLLFLARWRRVLSSNTAI